MSNVLISQLGRACAEQLLHEKWLIAPSLRVAHAWLEQVTRGGGPVVNVRVKTTRSLAVELLAAPLAEGRFAIAGAAARSLVVAAAWEQAVNADDGYLASVRVTPRLLSLAENTLADLRMAGIDEAALAGGRFEQPGKGVELRRLLSAFRTELDRRDLIDLAEAMSLATTRVRDQVSRWDRVRLLIPADLRTTVRERELLDAFPASCRIELPVDEPFESEPHETDGTDRTLLAWLGRPADAPPPAGDGAVHLTRAIGEVNEIRDTLRSCLAADVPLDQVEVVYMAREAYVPLLFETAQRILPHNSSSDVGVPVTFAEGVPAKITRPGRLLAAWMSWVHGGCAQSTLLRIIHAGLLAMPEVSDGDALTTGRAARALRSLSVGFGRERYASVSRDAVAGLERRLKAGRDRIDEDGVDVGALARIEQQLMDMRSLQRLLARLVEISPDESASDVDVVRSARDLLDKHSIHASKLDGLARRHLLDELDTMIAALDGVPDGAPAGFNAWDWLEALPERARVGGSGPRPGHLHAAPWHGGGHSGRPHTFVVGLDDSRFPPSGLPDPLLLDSERVGLGDRLPTAERRVHEQFTDFVRMLVRLRGRVTLSFPCYDVSHGAEMFAGPVILSAYRILSGCRDGDHSDLAAWLDPPASFAPRKADAALDSAEWWLAQGASEVRPANLTALVDGAFPHLARGAQAAAARASDRFTEYDGKLDATLDPTAEDGRVLSATSLQTLGRCPLAFFHERVLRLKPPEDLEVDPERWLDHRQFGILLHEVLYEFVGELIDRDEWPPQYDRNIDHLRLVLEKNVRRFRDEVPPPNEEAFRRQRDELDRAAHIFMTEEEHAGQTRRPMFLEASVGLPPTGDGTEIDTSAPHELPLPGGGRIRVSARFDRVDRTSDTGYSICDYKSGSYTAKHETSEGLRHGRLLQHALYIAVAESVLQQHFGKDTKVDEFRFFFPSAGARGFTSRFERSIAADGLKLIEQLCRLPASGAFPATNEWKEDCKFCNFKPSCYGTSRSLEALSETSARKMANSANALLQPLVEVRRDG